MKNILLGLLISFCFACTAHAEVFSLDEGGITFDAPQSFKPLPPELIAVKFPRGSAPRYVVGNKTGATTIAYDIKPHDMLESDVDDARVAFTRLFPGLIANLEWKKNETISISGRKWAILEMTSRAIDTDIYNIMLFTSYKGKMLVFNFNSTKKEFPHYEAALRNSINSITLKD